TVHQTEKRFNAERWRDFAVNTKTLHCDGHRTLLTEEGVGSFNWLTVKTFIPKLARMEMMNV
ncbi:hypothetical protein, partial [Acinetobacter baumannii]|uniref:hypothetical protein n=1 Tax=Acinetobacter baumannii TaxID=470 RepID=UPI00289D79C7